MSTEQKRAPIRDELEVIVKRARIEQQKAAEEEKIRREEERVAVAKKAVEAFYKHFVEAFHKRLKECANNPQRYVVDSYTDDMERGLLLSVPFQILEKKNSIVFTSWTSGGENDKLGECEDIEVFKTLDSYTISNKFCEEIGSREGCEMRIGQSAASLKNDFQLSFDARFKFVHK